MTCVGTVATTCCCVCVCARSSLRAVVAPRSAEHTVKPESFTLKAPIYDPQKVVCVGMNFADHWAEQNIPMPEEPVISSKFPSAITGPSDPIIYPEETTVRGESGQ